MLGAPTRPLRVVVAEDNRVNQLVVSRLLEGLGHIVTMCANGREAVTAVDRERPDVVMMDVQMPEMDGFAATAEIRRAEAAAPGAPRLPIIALTAFAMTGDRERCLAAGMDDYLSKPIKRGPLAAALQRAAGAAAPAFDVTGALAYTGGNRELLAELLGIFAEDAPGQVRAIEVAVRAADAEALAVAAHALKGSLRALGATAAAALAEELEALGRGAGSLDGAPRLLAALAPEMTRILAAAAGAGATDEPVRP